MDDANYIDAFRFFVEFPGSGGQTGPVQMTAQSAILADTTTITARITPVRILSRELIKHTRLTVFAYDSDGHTVLGWIVRYLPESVSVQVGPFDNDLTAHLEETITFRPTAIEMVSADGDLMAVYRTGSHTSVR